MKTITSIQQLEDLYGLPAENSLAKVQRHLTPLYRQWIEASKFLVIATVGDQGVDASPRGDDGPVAQIADDQTLMIPDWMGNNRLDSLRNIITDPRASLMFMVPGNNNVVRINGSAQISIEPDHISQFQKGEKYPRSVIVVTVGEAYFQCAKALMRSRLWQPVEKAPSLPTAGDFIKEAKEDFDGKTYDANYPEHAKARMW